MVAKAKVYGSLSSLKLAIAAKLSRASDRDLLWIARGLEFRRDWLSEKELPWSQGVDDYVKRMADRKLIGRSEGKR